MTEFEILEAMTLWGGSFVQQLAILIGLADPVNKRILLEAFPEYIEQYTELARLRKEASDRPINPPDDPVLPGWQLHRELCAYLDTLAITEANIWAIRQLLCMPWDCDWNATVRDETAKRERPAGEVRVYKPRAEHDQEGRS